MNKFNEWIQPVGTAITTAALILGALAWAWKRLKRRFTDWVSGVAEDSREAAKQLKTTNGTTVAQYVEAMAEKVNDNTTRLDKLEGRMGAVEGRLSAVENTKPVIVNYPGAAPPSG